jgi:hypothetical protein
MKQTVNKRVLPAFKAGTVQQRRASILVCVLVVLMVTGMLTLQGTRLLTALARASGDRARLEQAQELLALGRLRLSNQLDRSSAYDGESITVELPAGSATSESVAEIRIERLVSETTKMPRWRIIATHPYNQPGQVTASWESE